MRGHNMVAEQINTTIVLLIYLSFVVGIANICLLMALLYTYWKTYKELKSKFTIGLLYFTTFLLIQNIIVTLAVIIPLLIPLIPFQIPDYESQLLRPHYALFIVNLIQLVALTILYMITRE